LGIKQSVNQSTLSRANESRDWRISVSAKTPLNELLTKTQIKQNVKEQLSLFNFNEILTHH